MKNNFLSLERTHKDFKENVYVGVPLEGTLLEESPSKCSPSPAPGVTMAASAMMEGEPIKAATIVQPLRCHSRRRKPRPETGKKRAKY